MIVAAEDCTGLDWDETNRQATPQHAENVFFNQPLVVRGDILHSKAEKRYYALGQTRRRRHLFVAFTIWRKLIRVISARDMNRREEGP